MSNRYYVRVQETHWVWVDANDDNEAIMNAYEKAWREVADETDAEILEIEEEENNDE